MQLMKLSKKYFDGKRREKKENKAIKREGTVIKKPQLMKENS